MSSLLGLLTDVLVGMFLLGSMGAVVALILTLIDYGRTLSEKPAVTPQDAGQST